MFGKLRLIAGVVVLTIPLAHASEPAPGKNRAQDRTAQRSGADRSAEVATNTSEKPTLLRADLAAVFPDRGDAGVVRSEHGLTAPGGASEVIVARVGPDGKITLGCVDSEAAARRFFDAPADRLPGGRQEK